MVLEGRKLVLRKRQGGRHRDGERVARLTGDAELIVQVRAGGLASLTDRANCVVLRYSLAASDSDAAQVRIDRRVLTVVPDDDRVAIAAFHAGMLHDAVAVCWRVKRAGPDPHCVADTA